MDFEFDPAKDAENRRKHGISLARAVNFDSSSAVFELDDREEYGEERWTAIGFLCAILYAMTYTFRNDVLRVISLRKATTTEQKSYENHYDG